MLERGHTDITFSISLSLKDDVDVDDDDDDDDKGDDDDDDKGDIDDDKGDDDGVLHSRSRETGGRTCLLVEDDEADCEDGGDKGDDDDDDASSTLRLDILCIIDFAFGHSISFELRVHELSE